MEKIVPYGKDNDCTIVCLLNAGYGKRLFSANQAEFKAGRCFY
jgi:hypothetical protein